MKNNKKNIKNSNKEKSGILTLVKKVLISLVVFMLSYLLCFLVLNGVGLVRHPIANEEFIQTSTELKNLQDEAEKLMDSAINAKKEEELKKVKDDKEKKIKEIEELKNDIEGLKKNQ